jgi:hypothetical protein
MKKKPKQTVVKATEVRLVYKPLSSNFDAPQPTISISGKDNFTRDDFIKTMEKIVKPASEDNK